MKLIHNGAELGGATGAMAPLVFWSRSLKKSRKSRNQSLVVLSGTSCFYLRLAPMTIILYRNRSISPPENHPNRNYALWLEKMHKLFCTNLLGGIEWRINSSLNKNKKTLCSIIPVSSFCSFHSLAFTDLQLLLI